MADHMNPNETNPIPPAAIPHPSESRFRETVKALTPAPIRRLLRGSRMLLAARSRIFGEGPFNNEIDRALMVDPLWNHHLSGNRTLLDAISLCGTRAAMSSQEMLNLHRLVEATDHLNGAIAEVGVFRGGSARLIAHANRDKREIHLFDTFSGIPEVTPGLDTIKKNALAVGLPEVKAFLSDCKARFQFHVGFFPDSAGALADDLAFSFVNLDMDTYLSTKNGFEFFYPRMQRGGVILCHDYYSVSCPGVKPAVDEFLAGKPERAIGMWHSQIAVIKS